MLCGEECYGSTVGGAEVARWLEQAVGVPCRFVCIYIYIYMYRYVHTYIHTYIDGYIYIYIYSTVGGAEVARWLEQAVGVPCRRV